MRPNRDGMERNLTHQTGLREAGGFATKTCREASALRGGLLPCARSGSAGGPRPATAYVLTPTHLAAVHRPRYGVRSSIAAVRLLSMRLRDERFAEGNAVLDFANLSALWGPNDAGKTTVLLCVHDVLGWLTGRAPALVEDAVAV